MEEKIDFIIRIKGVKGYEFNDERTFTLEIERDEAAKIMRHMANYLNRKVKVEQRIRSLREQSEEKGENEVIMNH